MKIISPLFAQRNLTTTSQALARSLERLGTGKRINRAGDDASGLSISSGLEAQMRAMSQGVRNINDSFSMLQVAEGGLAAQTELVQRMRELAIQASNGTLSNQDRSNLNTEVQELLQEFERISQQTSFNGQNLLDGSLAHQQIQVGPKMGHEIGFEIPGSTSSDVFEKSEVLPVQNDLPPQFVDSGAPEKVELFDVNGNGVLDMVSLDTTANVISIHLGKGDGTFESPATFSVVAGAVDFAIGDINQDGSAQIVVASGSNRVTVYSNLLSNTPSSIQHAMTSSPTQGVHRVQLVDYSGNGFLDLVALSTDQLGSPLNSHIGIRYGSSTGFGTLSTTTLDLTASDFVVGDFGPGGAMRVAAIGSPTGFTVHNVELKIYDMVHGGLTLETSTILGFDWAADQLALADLDGSGQKNLVMSYEATLGAGFDSIRVFEDYIGSPLTALSAYKFGSDISSIRGADLSQNGVDQLLVTRAGDNNLTVMTLNRLDELIVQNQFDTGGSPGAMSVGDLNGDGILNVVTGDAGADSLSILFLTETIEVMTQLYSLDDLRVDSIEAAQKSLETLQDAIDTINGGRANIGAIQSQLESAAAVNRITQENLQSARSQILDADLAEETATLVKNQILQQAQVAVLGQVNASMQMVLALLVRETSS